MDWPTFLCFVAVGVVVLLLYVRVMDLERWRDRQDDHASGRRRN